MLGFRAWGLGRIGILSTVFLNDGDCDYVGC